MSRVDVALDLFKQGFSCSQSVLTAFVDDIGIDKEVALKVAAPFGGGISRTGGECGAALGAIMVIGLRYGTTRPCDAEAKQRTREMAQEFMGRFKARWGSVDCMDLLGHDLRDPKQAEYVKEHKIEHQRCPRYVQSAVEMLEEIMH